MGTRIGLRLVDIYIDEEGYVDVEAALGIGWRRYRAEVQMAVRVGVRVGCIR